MVRWQVRFFPASHDVATELWPGWEPFAATETGVWVRRLYEAGENVGLPVGVLSAGEAVELMNKRSGQMSAALEIAVRGLARMSRP